MRLTLITAFALGLLGSGGCREGDGTKATTTAAAAEAKTPPPTNRIDVPAPVRQNLGITFAKVERRPVASTIRVPGRFESLPTARSEYRATLPGWVRLKVNQFDEVAKDAPVFELDSPEWHRLRKQLHESQAAIEKATAELTVVERSKTEAEAGLKAVEQRVQSLAGAEVRRAELDAEVATRRASIPRLDAEINVKQAVLSEARHDFALEIDAAAALLGMSARFLTETVEQEHVEGEHDDGHEVQRWFAINTLRPTVRGPGVVESIHVSDGTWVEVNSAVVTVLNPTAVRFRATGLQSDLGKLEDGLAALIVPPQVGKGGTTPESVTGKLKVGLTADPERRTIDLLVTPGKVPSWARPGVSAFVEIYTADSGGAELAIPVSAVIRDELASIIFRRDPKNPDKVIRMEADLGISDGKWVVVNSGLREGDEVVLDGVYELKLAGGGKATGGGHFHADGTYHEAHGPERE